jgi:hypothetical protein
MELKICDHEESTNEKRQKDFAEAGRSLDLHFCYLQILRFTDPVAEFHAALLTRATH